MRKALAFAVATAAVGAVAACTPNGAGFPSSGLVGHGSTPSGGKTSQSAAPDGTGQSAASDSGMAQGSSSDSSSFVQPNSYAFRTVNDAADLTFNQLLGINSDGVIAGYFGSGAQGHPNKGFRVAGNTPSFANENFPGSVQTQVTAIDNRGVTVGFFSGMNNANLVNDNTAFYDLGGSFHRVAFPTTDKGTPVVEQLLGVNDSEIAVGFYTDAAGNNHGYEYNIGHHTFHRVTVAGATSTTAAAINNNGDVAGFFTGAGGATEAFLLTGHGKQINLAYPGASMTQAFGVNDHDEVVGAYTVGTGNNAQTHGFTWTAKGGFKTVDDPSGVGTTTVNGVNNAGDLVGFYVDGAGNTDGMLAKPSKGTTTVRHLQLAGMPTGTVTLSRGSDGMIKATVIASGLTPGSAHTVEIDAPGHNSPLVRFSSLLTADGTGNAHVTLKASGSTDKLPYGSRFVILLGVPSDGSANNALAAQPIARSGELSGYSSELSSAKSSGQPSGEPSGQPSASSSATSSERGYESDLNAVVMSTKGVDLDALTGRATITYNSAAQTLSVTLNASGLTPGAHAAHIHTGSCGSQGAVLYMLMDYQADSHGNVANQTRVVSGVPSMPAPGSWYLNVHLGDSNTIVANGAPALPFRPLLCANG